MQQEQEHEPHDGGLSDVLPVTTWGSWKHYPGALVASSATTQIPRPLANGGLYTDPQSTGAWASSPFPPTQYAASVTAAQTSHIPEVFFHQPVALPYVGSPATSKHYSATMGAKIGGNVATVAVAVAGVVAASVIIAYISREWLHDKLLR